jgi:DNA-binding transcriptional MerR regulator
VAFTTKEVAQIFGFAEPTVRKWAVEFGQYLSPTAHPGNGKKRSFAIEDLAVVALIAEHKERQATFEDIHAALKSGARGEPPEISEGQLRVISATEGEKRASLEIVAMQHNINQLTKRLEEAEAQAERAQLLDKENASLRTETTMLREQLDKSAEQLKQAQEDINRLSREVGTTHGQAYIEGYKAGQRERGGEGE